MPLAKGVESLDSLSRPTAPRYILAQGTQLPGKWLSGQASGTLQAGLLLEGKRDTDLSAAATQKQRRPGFPSALSEAGRTKRQEDTANVIRDQSEPRG